jgi:hypothetical protein
MHGDFSRLTFRPDKGFSAVLAQQGRLQLDADMNEQAAILTYVQRRVAADLIGRHAGPVNSGPDVKRPRTTAFEIAYQHGEGGTQADFTVGAGRYYVDGIMVDATKPAPLQPVPSDEPGGQVPGPPADGGWTYWTQPDAYLDKENDADSLPGTFPFFVYLKVWERFITAVEDPDILEKALGPLLPDTAGRVKVVWQVLPIRPADNFPPPTTDAAAGLRQQFDEWADGREQPAAWLAARSQQPAGTADDPCLIPPDSRYRGPENQFYRVEVHRAGQAGTDAAVSATFKWSRENGSVIFPVSGIEGTWVTLASPGRDGKLDVHVDDWVEVIDDAYVERGAVESLLQVAEVDVSGRRVRLTAEPGLDVGRLPGRHPYLRRWDHQAGTGAGAPRLWAGALQIQEGTWVDLELGVQVWFETGGAYRTGDYWLIPARTMTGDVEWPRDEAGVPLLKAPAGIRYHYAPLAWIASSQVTIPLDMRQQFEPLAKPVPPS